MGLLEEVLKEENVEKGQRGLDFFQPRFAFKQGQRTVTELGYDTLIMN